MQVGQKGVVIDRMQSLISLCLSHHLHSVPAGQPTFPAIDSIAAH
jgi:hypothetical protein